MDREKLNKALDYANKLDETLKSISVDLYQDDEENYVHTIIYNDQKDILGKIKTFLLNKIKEQDLKN